MWQRGGMMVKQYHPCGVCEICFDFCRCDPKPVPPKKDIPKKKPDGHKKKDKSGTAPDKKKN